MSRKNYYWILPVRCVLFFACFALVSLFSGKSLESLSRWWAILAVIINIICFALLLGLTKGEYKNFIDYKKGETKAGQMTLIVILLPLSTTLAEDGIYLGVINSMDGKKSVSIISALFYAAQHSCIPFLPDTRFMLYRFLSFLPLTILFCFWYRKTRNPLPFMAGVTGQTVSIAGLRLHGLPFIIGGLTMMVGSIIILVKGYDLKEINEKNNRKEEIKVLSNELQQELTGKIEMGRAEILSSEKSIECSVSGIFSGNNQFIVRNNTGISNEFEQVIG